MQWAVLVWGMIGWSALIGMTLAFLRGTRHSRD